METMELWMYTLLCCATVLQELSMIPQRLDQENGAKKSVHKKEKHQSENPVPSSYSDPGPGPGNPSRWRCKVKTFPAPLLRKRSFLAMCVSDSEFVFMHWDKMKRTPRGYWPYCVGQWPRQCMVSIICRMYFPRVDVSSRRDVTGWPGTWDFCVERAMLPIRGSDGGAMVIGGALVRALRCSCTFVWV